MQNSLRQSVSSIKRGDKLVINSDVYHIKDIKTKNAYCESTCDWTNTKTLSIDKVLLRYINNYFNTYLK